MTRMFSAFVLVGFGAFLFQVLGQHPEKAWQAYLVNFILWSAVAQGGLVFSVVLHVTKARWGRPLQGLSEAFAAFFPVSFALFLVLFLGKAYVFPWLGGDLYGKEGWLTIPFLFSRDAAGLLILYGLGFAYLAHGLKLKRSHRETSEETKEAWRHRMSVIGVLYLMAYALVLSLLAFDLVMSADPEWISTLFGPYAFVKAFYIGLGGLIIVAAVVHLRYREASTLTSSHFHDLGKLFFGFCMLWADFFYCQFLVIWYGNLPEETSYIIRRTMTLPWSKLAWASFILSFVIPFLILINRQVKTNLRFMIGLCSLVLVGIWLEHFLLLGPALSPKADSLPMGITDVLITLGFLGLMAMAVRFALRLFPELVPVQQQEVK
jgi:Ni/Fe-hydrogenase subunit HybB-like protein